MKISPARAAAFEILHRVETERAYSSILLPALGEKLEEKDRALCHELTLGTLRRQIYLDRVIENLTRNKKLDTAVKVALRLGLYQLLFLDKIPAHAAINESVNLVQKARKTSAKAFVNAVLRRVTREAVELQFSDDVDRLSVETSHPRFLLERWIEQFGEAAAEELARANNFVPRTAFRTTGITSADSARAVGRFEKSEFVEGCMITEKIDGELVELAKRGEIYFQDEGSQMVGQMVRLQPGERFFDVCAAPGSKTTQVAAEVDGSGAGFLAAGDLHWHRVKTLAENCRQQGAREVNVLQYDAQGALPFADGSFDVVLVDAPCTGTGTIRHNPEIRYFLQKKDFLELSGKQLEILKNASKLIKTSGKLIYSTCSLEKEENELVCRKFLEENPEFEVDALPVSERFMTGEGFARTFPSRDKMDGFFVARFAKRRFSDKVL